MEIIGIDLVDKKLRGFDNKINQAASNAVNRTATYARNQGIDEIVARVTLKRPYVTARIKVITRSSPVTLRAVIASQTRATLLDRFDSLNGRNGIKVRVLQSQGYKTINGSFRVKNLRGSRSTGIAVSNAVAAKYYADKYAQSGLQLFASLAAKTGSKKGGIHVLHSMSIDQLFRTARVKIKPNVDAFLMKRFLENISD